METFLPAACWSKRAFPQCWHWCSSFSLGWGLLPPPPRPHGDTVQVFCSFTPSFQALFAFCSLLTDLVFFNKVFNAVNHLQCSKNKTEGTPLQQEFFFLILRVLRVLAEKCSEDALWRAAFTLLRFPQLSYARWMEQGAYFPYVSSIWK